MKKKTTPEVPQPASTNVSALLSVDQAMQILGITSKTTLVKLIQKHGLPFVQWGDDCNYRFRPESLAAWILENERRAG